MQGVRPKLSANLKIVMGTSPNMISLLSGACRRHILTCGLRMAVIAVALFGTLSHASATETNYSGHYDLAQVNPDRVFSLQVQQTGSKAKISFFAAMVHGSESAPYAVGDGRVEDGLLSFDFKDSFNNKGTCTLESKKDGFHLTMTVTQMVEPHPTHFYGNLLLKKTSN